MTSSSQTRRAPALEQRWSFTDVLNRFLVSLLALLVLAGAVITILVAMDVIAPEDLRMTWFQQPLRDLAATSGGTLALIIGLSVLAGLAALGLLLAELLPPRNREQRSFVLSEDEEGAVTIDAQSVRELAERMGVVNRNVRDLRCQIAQADGSLNVACRAAVALGSNVPEITEQVREKVKESIEGLVGIPVAYVDVKTTYSDGDRRRRTGVQ